MLNSNSQCCQGSRVYNLSITCHEGSIPHCSVYGLLPKKVGHNTSFYKAHSCFFSTHEKRNFFEPMYPGMVEFIRRRPVMLFPLDCRINQTLHFHTQAHSMQRCMREAQVTAEPTCSTKGVFTPDMFSSIKKKIGVQLFC